MTSHPPLSFVSRHYSTTLRGVGLFVLVILVYLPAFQCGFIWDDDDYILENSAIKSADGFIRIWCDPSTTPQYYPMVHSMFWIEYHLWGLNPTGYHAINVLLHACSCVLLWRLLVCLNIPGAWLAAAVFGVHPVHVESVAWITERKNVLSGLCYLGALKLYWPIVELLSQDKSVRVPFPFRQYVFATLLFLAALLSKSVTCSLPAAILVLTFWRRGRVSRDDVTPLLLWFLMGGLAAIHTSWLERTNVGAVGDTFAWTFPERCWIAGNALWFYLGKLIWPTELTFFYPRWPVVIDSAACWLAPFAAISLPILFGLARHRLGRGPFAAVLRFGGTLLPALSFANVFPMRYSFVADHFQYLASLSPIVFLAAITSRGMFYWQRHSQVGVNFWLTKTWPLLVLAPLCVICWRQQSIYRNVESLWTDTLAKNPSGFAAQYHLGHVRAAQGRHAEASEMFKQAFENRTDDLDAALMQTHRGISLAREGKVAEARVCLVDALRLEPNNWEALHGLANLEARQKRLPEAIELYRRVLQLRPSTPIVYVNLGNALAVQGDLDGAIDSYRTGLKLTPNSADAHFNLANAFVRKGQFLEAEQHYLSVLSIQPNHSMAQSNLRKLRIKQHAPSK